MKFIYLVLVWVVLFFGSTSFANHQVPLNQQVIVALGPNEEGLSGAEKRLKVVERNGNACRENGFQPPAIQEDEITFSEITTETFLRRLNSGWSLKLPNEMLPPRSREVEPSCYGKFFCGWNGKLGPRGIAYSVAAVAIIAGLPPLTLGLVIGNQSCCWAGCAVWKSMATYFSGGGLELAGVSAWLCGMNNWPQGLCMTRDTELDLNCCKRSLSAEERASLAKTWWVFDTQLICGPPLSVIPLPSAPSTMVLPIQPPSQLSAGEETIVRRLKDE